MGGFYLFNQFTNLKNLSNMKKVFSTSSEVFHLFANKTQQEATNQSRNAFFNSDGLFSYGYHYKLAYHLKGGAILINNRGYSVTTSKHINEISHASRHKKQFFANSVFIKDVLQEVEYLLTKLPKARQRKLEYIATIKSLFNSFQAFQKYAKENKINKIYWSNNTILRPIIDKRSKDYKRLLYIAQNMQNLDILESEVLKEKAKQDKRKAKEQKQLIKDFRNCKRNFVRLNYDLLRLEYNKNNINFDEGFFVRTSQNVKIKINEAITTINTLQKLNYNCDKINANLRGYKISHYSITKAQNKALFVGCHKIKFEEIKRFAKQLYKINKH
jgi:hypothetical protein